MDNFHFLSSTDTNNSENREITICSCVSLYF